ncbi:MAG: cardiolipin synthase [Bulleidia sp.]|nr:cardiolipin synthase [Bulleidia sp.]
MKRMIGRIIPIALGLLVEYALISGIVNHFMEQAAWLEGILRLLGAAVVLSIIRNSKHLSSDMMWILLIMLFPVPGILLFLIFGADLLSSKTTRGIYTEQEKARKYAEQDEAVLQEIRDKDPVHASQYSYLAKQGFPVSRNQGYDYYGSGEEGWPVMLEEMKKAKKYIFLEYFIIEEGKMWNGMLDILKEKAKEGVECRVMYDDLGSLGTVPASYAKKLESYGIKAMTFNKLSPFLSIVMNHRDHRKIMVIDGKVGFTGGVNLADEYINAIVKHGYWKDTVVRVKGKAVDNLLRLFLTNWNALRHEDDDYTKFYGEHEEPVQSGYVCAYGESPFSEERVAQNVYMNMINQATQYVHIMTPYLIIDSDFINALILAAKRGVDVRIVTPGVPDKKMVWGVTRSYYENLIKGGVHVHEYTPGFDHAKVFVSDDVCATVGTVNLDYRSLYLHFENGTLIYEADAVKHIAEDTAAVIAQSHEMTLEESRTSILKGLFWNIVRVFAPLM